MNEFFNILVMSLTLLIVSRFVLERSVTDLTVEFVAKEDTPLPIPEPSLILAVIPCVFGFFQFKARVQY